jgi:hypothetical protein
MQSRAAIGRRIVEPAPQRMAEQPPPRSALADALNARPAVQQLQAMSALLTRRRGAGSEAVHDVQGRGAQQPVQMMHPAYNSLNFWRAPVMDPETERLRPHPLSPEGKMQSLSQEFGTKVAKLILRTELDEDEAVRREDLTRRFYEEGGSPWEALRLLKNHPKDNSVLEDAYAFHLATVDPKEIEEASTDEDVQNRLKSLSRMSEFELLDLRKSILALIESNPERLSDIRPRLIAVNMALRERSAQGAQQVLLTFRYHAGFGIRVYGRPFLKESHSAQSWIGRMVEGLLNASFLAERRPPLQIRIIIHDRKSKDVASTHADGNLITVNIEEYQVNEFSTGQMLGLVAHELGVHTLGKLTLSPEELEAEAKDKETGQKGTFAGTSFTVGRDPKAKRQQDDHLTIGRAILGQKSAAPRLGMYEKTMISLIEAQRSEDDRRETAAAYCIDIARIVLLNDTLPTGLLQGLGSLNGLANAAVAEWSRIQKKYGEAHPKLKSVDLGYYYMLGAITRLGALAYSLRNRPSSL